MIGVMLLVAGTVMGEDISRVLFDFTGADAAKEWQLVNDGVMGGVSHPNIPKAVPSNCGICGLYFSGDFTGG